MVPSNVSDQLFDKLDLLDQENMDALANEGIVKDRITIVKALLDKGVGDKDKLQALQGKYEKLAQQFSVATAAYSAMAEALSSADGKSSMTLASIIAEYAAWKAVDDNQYALFVKVNSTTSGSYAKKNLWTTFGAMPFFVSGGAVITYTLVRREDGRVLGGGVLPFECGYRKVNNIASPEPVAVCAPSR